MTTKSDEPMLKTMPNTKVNVSRSKFGSDTSTFVASTVFHK